MLTESLVGLSACAIILTAVTMGTIALNRSFSASDQYATAQNSQLRVMDYLTRDLRRAQRIIPQADNTRICIELPDYYDKYDNNGDPILNANSAIGSNPRNPDLTGNFLQWGPEPLQVTYFRDPVTNALIRQVDWKVSGVARQSQRVIADGVQNFETTFESYGTVVQATITFLPTFQKVAEGLAREGTTLRAAVTLRNVQL